MGTIVDLGVAMSKKDIAAPVWIQIAKQGSFKGHPSGPFEMSETTFREIIRNFKNQKNQFIPADYEHASEQPAHMGSIPMHGAPAQGWVTDLAIRDGNLWGLVLWGDQARQQIRNGQYRYLSPAIVFGAKDRVTGENIGARLSSIALTNSPYLDGLAPLAAKYREVGVSGDVVRVICNALKLPDYIDARGACMTMRHIENMHGSPPPGVAPNFAASQATALRDALRLPLTMSVTDVFAHARIACGEVSPPTSSAAVQENHQPMNTAKEKVMSENENKETEVSKLTLKLAESQAEVRTLKADTEQKITTLTAENTALKTKVAEFENHQLESRVDMAMQIWGEKKGLSSEMRPHLLTFARTAPESFNAMYPQPAPGQQRPLGRQVASGPHNVPVPQIGAGGIAPEPGGARVIPMHGGAGASPTIEMCLSQVRKEAKEQGIQLDRETEYANAHTLLINLAADKRLAGNGG